MSYDARPIGVFDSGIGGLTVLRHLMRLMPEEDFVYLGDTARVPYGNKSPETVRLYASQCASFLQQHHVKMIVVACNTASALALDQLRAHYTIPVLGVIDPAAAQAARVSRTGSIGVIGTRATINSESYVRAITAHAGSVRTSIHARPCPLFVPLVEEGWIDTPATRLVADEYLRPLREAGIDTLVLGCTHYPILAPVLADLLPGVQLIDCGECTAIEASQIVMRQNPEHRARLSLYVTDNTPAFSTLAATFLGRHVDEPVRISIDSFQQPGAAR
ncbi:MAG: glutamate racemase [Candidatus Kapabacteria bacterium]|nr:glutamate racemase [Candidatus Kapabacteria bacterium]